MGSAFLQESDRRCDLVLFLGCELLEPHQPLAGDLDLICYKMHNAS